MATASWPCPSPSWGPCWRPGVCLTAGRCSISWSPWWGPGAPPWLSIAWRMPLRRRQSPYRRPGPARRQGQPASHHPVYRGERDPLYGGGGATQPGLLRPVSPGPLVILGYSFTKRFTSASHLVLGLSLGLAPVGGWLAVRGDLGLPVLVLAGAVLFWVAGFDILYALAGRGL